MKTTKAITALLSLLVLMPACTTTKQQYAGVDVINSRTFDNVIPVMHYVDHNNNIRPFCLPY
jgi:hypothetical protein